MPHTPLHPIARKKYTKTQNDTFAIYYYYYTHHEAGEWLHITFWDVANTVFGRWGATRRQ